MPGVEIRDVENSWRKWRCFSTGVEFLAPKTWYGEIVYGQRQESLSPGKLFCSHPGDVFTSPRITQGGAGSALVLEPSVLSAYLEELGLPSKELDMRHFVEMSPRLSSKLHEVFAAMNPSTSALQTQSSLAEFVEVMVSEVGINKPQASELTTKGTDAAERVREYLHYEQSADIDLQDLVRETGMSRFRVLRAFKRRYGLPPHAYQLCVRVGLAQRSLRAGQRPAQVAADFGFVDQSHFTRHFRRLLGITPAKYVRSQL